MIEMQLLDVIIEKGVTIVVLAWFMFRMEKVIKCNTETLDKVHYSILRIHPEARK